MSFVVSLLIPSTIFLLSRGEVVVIGKGQLAKGKGRLRDGKGERGKCGYIMCHMGLIEHIAKGEGSLHLTPNFVRTRDPKWYICKKKKSILKEDILKNVILKVKFFYLQKLKIYLIQKLNILMIIIKKI